MEPNGALAVSILSEIAALPKILLLEDEPFILMELEFSAGDAGLTSFSVSNVAAALAILRRENIDVAILDVNLGGGATCLPVARELTGRSIPYLLHTAQPHCLGDDLQALSAPIISKPAAGSTVVSAALELMH